MDNITIIDLDLGLKVKDLIQREIVKLSQTSQDKLDATIEYAKEIENQRIQKEEADTQKAGAIHDLHAELLNSSDGIESKQMQIKYNMIASTPSALTLKIKSYLKSLGNQHRLVKNLIDGKSYFKLVPFNAE
jgi:hypothetical protein